MNRNRKKTAGRARRLAALGLAGCLVMGTGMQASAATMKDLFDEHFYADTYPDLKAAFGYNRQALWKHFITYGLKENRNMNNLIDIAKYREKYADLEAAFGNNWDAYVNHFLTHGAKEGRDSGTDFNALDYAGRYADLKEAFGDDVMALYKHYKTTGITEHREARGEKVIVAEQAAQAAASNPTSTVPSNPAADPSQETPAYTLLTDENGNVYDLRGATVYLYAWYGEGEMDTDYWRAVNEYRDWAQKTYNFTMVWDGAGNWGSYGDFADLASGAKDTEGKLRMYLLPGGVPGVVDAMRNNLMWDLSSLGVFDFGSGWYKTNGVADLYRMNSDVYACSAQPPEARTGMVFNATLLEELTGITADQMYDWQKNGQWTWEKFEEICELIRANGDTDGDGDQDYFAIAGNQGTLVYSLVNSNGTTFFKLNSEGKFEYHVEDPATKEALEFYQKIMRTYYYHNPDLSEDSRWDYFYDAFDKEGKLVFLPELAYQFHDGFLLNKNTENAGTYGFLMFPIGPRAGGKFINTYADNIWVIPKCYTEEEAKTIAAAYNIWFADIPGYSGYNSRIDGYKDGVHDDRALNETLVRMMSEGTYIDSSALLGVGSMYLYAWTDLNRTVDDIISANRDQWMEAVEEYNNR